MDQPDPKVRALLDRRLTIAVIEDNSDNRELLTIILHDRGHHVFSYSDAEAALIRIAEEPVDLVLCDLILPGMSGFEFIHALRSRPDRTPAVACTGYQKPGLEREAREAGFDAVILKPVLDMSSFLTQLEQLAQAIGADVPIVHFTPTELQENERPSFGR